MSIWDDMADELYGENDSVNYSFDPLPTYEIDQIYDGMGSSLYTLTSADNLIATPEDWLDTMLWIRGLP